MKLFCLIIIFLVKFQRVSGHGTMVKPYSWFDKKTWIPTKKGGYVYDYVGMKSGMMCFAGNYIKHDEVCPNYEEDCAYFKYPGESCMWYKNYTLIERPLVFDEKFLTYPHHDQKKLLHNPWRAPGSAPVDSPCGVAGGNLNGCIGGECDPRKGGYGHGPRAEQFDFKHSFYRTNWTRGEDVEVAWGIVANHGGGYSYRLCKIPDIGVSGVTEECFQRTHLQFSGDVQWVQYGEDETTRKEFKAVRLNTGTFPKGSQWSRNPIPACIGHLGGFLLPTPECPDGTQFQPPLKGLYGFGTNFQQSFPNFQFSIIDKVTVPKDLDPGEYVLSFRWDAEQTPQVWNTCASVILH